MARLWAESVPQHNLVSISTFGRHACSALVSDVYALAAQTRGLLEDVAGSLSVRGSKSSRYGCLVL